MADMGLSVMETGKLPVQGGPVKRFVFTYLQPALLFGMIGFWMLAPDSIATAATLAYMSIASRVMLIVLEHISERHTSWRITWKEFATDLFFLGLAMTLVKLASKTFGGDVPIEAFASYLDIKFAWFLGMPLLVQAAAIILVAELTSYWMHRWQHNWGPLWRVHGPHHHITQMNALKGSTGNPIELFINGLAIGGLFDFLPRAALLAGGIKLAIGAWDHHNIRFNTPRWFSYLFVQIEHHSLHHSQDYDSSRKNFASSCIFMDRIFGTYGDEEAERVGIEGRRLSIQDHLLFPFEPLIERMKPVFQRLRYRGEPAAIPAE